MESRSAASLSEEALQELLAAAWAGQGAKALKGKHDALFLLLHVILARKGFRLVGLGEDGPQVGPLCPPFRIHLNSAPALPSPPFAFFFARNSDFCYISGFLLVRFSTIGLANHCFHS